MSASPPRLDEISPVNEDSDLVTVVIADFVRVELLLGLQRIVVEGVTGHSLHVARDSHALKEAAAESEALCGRPLANRVHVSVPGRMVR